MAARNYVTYSGASRGFQTATDDSALVDSTDSVIVAANTARRYLLLVNLSQTVLYLGLGHAAVVGKGIPLAAASGAGAGDGGAYEMSGANGNLFLGAIHAITASGDDKALAFMEGV